MTASQAKTKSPGADEQTAALVEKVREKVQTCIQCGTCTGSCPNAFAMDLTPRQLWRLVITGQTAAVFESHTFALCSACYCCTLRCPRGLPLTEAMGDLKQIAARQHLGDDFAGQAFYRLFLQSIRHYGRVQETYLMSKYLATMSIRRPRLPMTFTPLGFRLMGKGKLSVRRPPKTRSLERVFEKIEAMRDAQ